MLTLNRPPSRTSIQLPAEGPDESLDSDMDFEYELIAFLGHLELLREGMAAARLTNRSGQLVGIAQTFSDTLAAFVEKHCAFASSRETEDASNRAAECRGALAQLREQIQESGRIQPHSSLLVQRFLNTLVESVIAYFVVFTSRFSTSRSARPWVEVAATFVAELKQLARDPVPTS